MLGVYALMMFSALLQLGHRLVPGKPSLSEPQRWHCPYFGGFGAAVVDGGKGRIVLMRLLRILNENVEILVLVKNAVSMISNSGRFPRFLFSSKFVHKEARFGVLVQHLHVAVRSRIK